MSKFVFPKHQVSVWDSESNAYVAAGNIINIDTSGANYGSDLSINLLANTNSDVNVNMPLAFLSETATGDEILCRVRVWSSTRLFNFTYKNGVTVYVELLPTTELSQYFIVLFKIKVSKPITTDKITLTVADVSGIVIPVRSDRINMLGDGFAHLGMGKAGAATYVTYYNAVASSENLYTTSYDEDSKFVATQVIFNTYSDAYNYARIPLGVDLKKERYYYINWADIADAYSKATGRYLSSNVRLIFRTITNPVIFGSDDKQPEAAPMAALNNYSVGVITPVTDFKVSEDGYTITGKYNAWCNVAMVFNSNAPISFTTQADGTFSYTSKVNLNVGGIMRLTPSNLIGSHAASVLNIQDKMAPAEIANVTVTANGVYGTAEVGATIKLYSDEDVLLATYVVPSSGLVEILFDTPIPSDISSKVFHYSIADASNNILSHLSIEYVGGAEAETGPMTHAAPDHTKIMLVNSSSELVK